MANDICPVSEGDLVFVKAKFQAEQQGVGFPDRIFSGWVAQLFPGHSYVNVLCANTQFGPAWFKANSVSHFSSTEQDDNIFALRREDLEKL